MLILRTKSSAVKLERSRESISRTVKKRLRGDLIAFYNCLKEVAGIAGR